MNKSNLVVSLFLVGCSHPAPSVRTTADYNELSTPNLSTTSGPIPTTTQTTATGCDPNSVALHGVPALDPWALYVPVVHDGAPAYLHLDSAGPDTILVTDTPEWTDFAGTVTLACESIDLPGYGGLGEFEQVGGINVIGYAGADLLLARPTLVDRMNGQLQWDPTDLSAVADGVTIPYDNVYGILMIDATLDGIAVRLIVDTGAAHSLWLGVEPELGDAPVDIIDSLGDTVTMYFGTASLGLGDATGVVPLLRAPTFSVLEMLTEILGTRIDGLLGLSSATALLVNPGDATLTVALVETK